MQTLVNITQNDFVVNGIHWNVGLSTFLQSMMVTKKSTESIQKIAAMKFVAFIFQPRNLKFATN